MISKTMRSSLTRPLILVINTHTSSGDLQVRAQDIRLAEDIHLEDVFVACLYSVKYRGEIIPTFFYFWKKKGNLAANVDFMW